MPGGYDQIYLRLLPKAADCDLQECAARLGMKYVENKISVPFLGRTYHIDANGVTPQDGFPVDDNTKSVLLYYLISFGRGEPKGSYARLGRMTGMIEGQNSLGGSFMEDKLLRVFGKDYAGFVFAAEKLGGINEGSDIAGKHTWFFQLLPQIPAKIIFYEKDDEFSAEVQLWLDAHAPRFMEFECLAFLSGCLMRSLIKTYRYRDVKGWT